MIEMEGNMRYVGIMVFNQFGGKVYGLGNGNRGEGVGVYLFKVHNQGSKFE